MKQWLLAFLVAATLIGFVYASDVQAQFSVGLQSPLSVFGQLQWGALALELGAPLRFNFDSFGAFANLKWMFEPFDLGGIASNAFVGAGGQILWFDDRFQPSYAALLGLAVAVPDTPLSVHGMLWLDPNFSTGLLESIVIGVGYRF